VLDVIVCIDGLRQLPPLGAFTMEASEVSKLVGEERRIFVEASTG